jgi:hypothetical protein
LDGFTGIKTPGFSKNQNPQTQNPQTQNSQKSFSKTYFQKFQQDLLSLAIALLSNLFDHQ